MRYLSLLVSPFLLIGMLLLAAVFMLQNTLRGSAIMWRVVISIVTGFTFYFSSQVEYDKFKDEMELALAYLKGTENNIVLSSAYMLLGADALNYGQTNLGLDYFLLSKYYADLSDINEIKSVADFYMSGFYITIGEYDRALYYAKISYDEALHPSEYRYSFFESDGIDMAVCMLGQCYIWMGQFD
jgi:hypothetical protein